MIRAYRRQDMQIISVKSRIRPLNFMSLINDNENHKNDYSNDNNREYMGNDRDENV